MTGTSASATAVAARAAMRPRPARPVRRAASATVEHRVDRRRLHRFVLGVDQADSTRSACPPYSMRYFPVSSPPPSGDHSAAPSPSASAIGRFSRSPLRSTRLYSNCTPEIGDQPPQFGQGHRTCRHPRREVRQPGVENLAGAREIVEAAHDLVERGDEVREVHPQQVDVVGVEPAQTAFYRPEHGAPAVAGLQHAIAFGDHRWRTSLRW